MAGGIIKTKDKSKLLSYFRLSPFAFRLSPFSFFLLLLFPSPSFHKNKLTSSRARKKGYYGSEE